MIKTSILMLRRKEVSKSKYNVCPLCDRFSRNRSRFSGPTVGGISYSFDTMDCLKIFNRFPTLEVKRSGATTDSSYMLSPTVGATITTK